MNVRVPHPLISFAVRWINGNCFLAVINGSLMLVQFAVGSSTFEIVDSIPTIQFNGPTNFNTEMCHIL